MPNNEWHTHGMEHVAHVTSSEIQGVQAISVRSACQWNSCGMMRNQQCDRWVDGSAQHTSGTHVENVARTRVQSNTNLCVITLPSRGRSCPSSWASRRTRPTEPPLPNHGAQLCLEVEVIRVQSVPSKPHGGPKATTARTDEGTLQHWRWRSRGCSSG